MSSAEDILNGLNADGVLADLHGQHPTTQPEPAQWEAPVPLGTTRRLPAFPTEELPDWVAAMVAGIAEETQTPADLAGCISLAALSTAAGGRALVQVRGTYTEPVNLFTVVAMPPASRKSAVFRAMCAPLLQAEKDLAERIRPQITEAKLARELAASAAEKAKQQAAASNGAPDKLAEASDAAVAIDQIKVPVEPQLVADDVTPETAASILTEQGGRLAVLSAEGGIFQILAGRYSGTPNFDLFLKGHAGDMLRVDRKGRAAEHVDSAILTLGLAVQPEVITEIATGPGFRGKGLLGRFLYALPESNVGRRKVDPDPCPDDVVRSYGERLQRMVNALFDWQDDPIRLQLSPEADQQRIDYAAAIEPRLHAQTGDLGHVADWAGKSVGAIVRMAGLIHLAANPVDGYRQPISGETMAAAVRLGEYFTAHALAAFDHMGADPEAEKAQLVKDWLSRKKPTRFTVREAFNGLPRGTFRKVADLQPALELLESHGWIRAEPRPVPSAKGGRPPSPAYEVHPELLGAHSGPGA
ncbi:YfjI family protein [Streptomonospora wellingtoniae]|uniref:YfjI family protein n=1 Tax=Streptomonospora wellingtoniae TaxID=3075544 RepID=A0ABU2KXF6_9ACTN|nr:YfjI family protein [Streptomonospora sp. DSM 45055]MDT0303984.1 YfjI family protein [Streptomonospora sp. DSM 45055]